MQLGYKSVKWVERIELSDKVRTGYWEANGYPEDAPAPGSLSPRRGAGACQTTPVALR